MNGTSVEVTEEGERVSEVQCSESEAEESKTDTFVDCAADSILIVKNNNKMLILDVFLTTDMVIFLLVDAKLIQFFVIYNNNLSTFDTLCRICQTICRISETFCPKRIKKRRTPDEFALFDINNR